MFSYRNTLIISPELIKVFDGFCTGFFVVEGIKETFSELNTLQKYK